MKPIPTINKRRWVFTLLLLFAVSQMTNAQNEKSNRKIDSSKLSTVSEQAKLEQTTTPSAGEQLKNFQHDPSNPMLSKLNYALLHEKVELEKIKQSGTFSEEDIKLCNERIGNLEMAIDEHQRLLKSSIERDLTKQDGFSGKIIITQEAYEKAHPDKQALIKSEPEKYMIVDNPKEKSVQLIKKSEFESFPAEKQQMIIGNTNYQIID